tara:strand:+ start:41 stop:229 length:189 start_codon:yes stop_codon:yes gene_type:complete
MAKYKVQWQTTTTHQATIEAKSDNDLFNNFGCHTYDDQWIEKDDYINGSYKIIKVESEVAHG